MESPHLFEQIRRNKRNSVLLMIAVILVLVILGFVIGAYYGDPITGLSLAGAFALPYSAISYFAGDKMVLSSLGAKPAAREAYPQLYNIVEEMAIASGLPLPKVYVIPSNASNAFASGRSPEKGSISVTTGLLEVLNREELQGVIGHEMGHIKNFDTRLAILMAVLVGAIALLCDAFWRSMRHRRRSSSKGGGQAQLVILLVAVLLAILAPIAAKLIQFAMSRRRELLADNTAAELTRNPLALAKALEKITADPDPLDLANRGTQHLFIINPLRDISSVRKEKKESEKPGWFDTHPPPPLRIRLLREMAHEKIEPLLSSLSS